MTTPTHDPYADLDEVYRSELGKLPARKRGPGPERDAENDEPAAPEAQ